MKRGTDKTQVSLHKKVGAHVRTRSLVENEAWALALSPWRASLSH